MTTDRETFEGNLQFEGKARKAFCVEAHADLYNANPVYLITIDHHKEPFVVCRSNGTTELKAVSRHEFRTDAYRDFARIIEGWMK